MFFERAVKGDLVDSIVIVAMIFSTNDLKEYFSTSENEIRTMITLATYYCHLQMKGETSFWFYRITKEDYDNFKS